MKKLEAIFIAAVLGAFAQPAEAANPRNKTATSSADADAASPTIAKAGRNSGFFSADDRMYLLENGRAIPVTTQYLLRVDRKGIVGFDGRPIALPEGYMLNPNGQIVPLPKEIKGLPDPKKAPPPPNSEAPLGEPPPN
jgi:hypothetical protein